ncbi:MAG: hypothetical protein Q8N34_03405 [Gammaproteobacteria bacterium]|nr:hypothetical protein [Gammaproteobacteria bacterium]
MKTELTLRDGTVMAALPCPHCGSGDLFITEWAGDEGEVDAVACRKCGEALASLWNQRISQPEPVTVSSLRIGQFLLARHGDHLWIYSGPGEGMQISDTASLEQLLATYWKENF